MKLPLYFPVKPLFINQTFGEVANLAYYRANGIPFVGHNGIDFSAKHGQPIYAAHDGNAYPEVDDRGGQGVVITTKEMFDYEGGQAYFKTIYWHLIDASAVVKWGQEVKAGDLIGYADSTGLSTGDHLHFGLKAMLKGEPAGAWYNIEQNNGYMGAINPMPYFNGLFAEDIRGYQFNENMQGLQRSEDIRQLQAKLQRLGYFPKTETCTGFYGTITTKAVYQFQLDHVPKLSWAARNIYKGMFCYEATRDALNSIT